MIQLFNLIKLKINYLAKSIVSSSAENGAVVVALTEEGNTLKRLFWEEGRPRLHAENKKYKPIRRDIYPETLIIQGIALKVIKDIT